MSYSERVELIRELWTGKDVTFKGKYYQTDKARLSTPPAFRIPISISALVPHSAEFAGKYGDGLFSVGGKQPEIYQQLRRRVPKLPKLHPGTFR